MAALALSAALMGQVIDYSMHDALRLRKHLIYDTYIDSGAQFASFAETRGGSPP